MSAREHTSAVKYKVSIEGADESLSEFQGLLGEVSRGIGLFAQLDHLTLSYARAAKQLDLRSFLSVTLSTISAMTSIIRLIKNAELAQLAYNAALVVTRLLEGPRGWAILGVAAVGAGVGIGYAAATYTPPSSKISEDEAWRREMYRRFVPG